MPTSVVAPGRLEITVNVSEIEEIAARAELMPLLTAEAMDEAARRLEAKLLSMFGDTVAGWSAATYPSFSTTRIPWQPGQAARFSP